MNVENISLKFNQPWKIEICHFNVSDIINSISVNDEILTVHCLSKDDDYSPFIPTEDICPEIIKLRDLVITPKVIEYVQKVFNINIDKFKIDTFAKWFKEHQSLGAHLHGGTAITTVYYPADVKSNLVLFDPRGNACRGYPKEVRDNHFGQYNIYPKSGDIYILPSYIQHSVNVVKEEMRLSLVNDYSFL